MEHSSENEQSHDQSPAYPQPPVLSFRSFHERHFSKTRQQEFFASAYNPAWGHPFYNWSHEFNAYATEAISVENKSHLTRPFEFKADGEPDVEVETRHEAEFSDSSIQEDSEPPLPNLTKEAIEIFEFSRRFRQEKEAAKLSEQKKNKKRKTKRQKLTELGFAFDEGNSGSDEDDAAIGGLLEHKKSENDSSESDDDSEIAQEPAPTDTSFILQKSRRSDNLRKELYGQHLDVTEIETLECLVNQAYEESLIPQNFILKESDPGTRARPNSGGNHGTSQRSKVVYWPGMPLRC